MGHPLQGGERAELSSGGSPKVRQRWSAGFGNLEINVYFCQKNSNHFQQAEGTETRL